MTVRSSVVAVWVVALMLTGLLPAQRRGLTSRFYDEEYVQLPADAGEVTEFTFARLAYPSFRGWGWGRGGGSWRTDYPKADRQFLQGVRRLTRIHSRSVEQVVDLEGDEIYNYPWIYAVEVGHWDLPDDQAARLRDYLLRRGFLMVDDFHGTYEWDVFLASMQRVFPGRRSSGLPLHTTAKSRSRPCTV